jgi:hypothetical protein
MNHNRKKIIELTITALNFLVGDDITSSARSRDFTDYRYIGYSFLRKSGFSLQEIGGAFNRHHASVLYGLNEFKHAYKNIESFRDKNSDFLFTYNSMLDNQTSVDSESKMVNLQQKIDYYEALMKSDDFVFALDVVKKCSRYKSVRNEIEKIIYKFK